MKNIFVIFALAISLSGCVTITQQPKPPAPVVISSNPPVVPPTVKPVTPAPVQWKVYNASELKAMTATGTLPSVIFTLDETNFKNLANNLVDIKNYIDQQKLIINFLTKAANVPSSNTTPPVTESASKK
jgi:hypothetical protein